MKKYKIFDGHNDVLFRLYLKNHNLAYQDFLNGDNEGQLDLPRMKEANFKGVSLQYMYHLKRRPLQIVINLLNMMI